MKTFCNCGTKLLSRFSLPQILIHVLQGLEALGQVLVVKLGAKVVGVLLHEALGAHDVEAAALLYQGHGGQVAQLLLGQVLADGAGRGPDVLEPLAHVLVGAGGLARAAQRQLTRLDGLVPKEEMTKILRHLIQSVLRDHIQSLMIIALKDFYSCNDE